MKSISELVSSRVEVKYQKDERAQVIKEIYEIYSSPTEKKLRRVENWKRYCEWCRANRYPNSLLNQKIFRQSHNFIRIIPIGSFCFFTSHLSVTDLYYILSVAKDKGNRGESVGAFIMSQHKKKNATN